MAATQEDVDRFIANMDQMAKKMQSLTLENKNIKEKLNMVSNDVKFYDAATGGVQINSELLPEKFSASDIPKFQATNDPFLHLKAFDTIMSLKKIDRKLYPSMFALSLDHIPQKWFFKQEPSDVATWEGVTRVFVARYQCNVEADSLHRKLDNLKQRENEGFTEF